MNINIRSGENGHGKIPEFPDEFALGAGAFDVEAQNETEHCLQVDGTETTATRDQDSLLDRFSLSFFLFSFHSLGTFMEFSLEKREKAH